MARNDLHEFIGNDEKILWEARPDKKCFIFESIFNPMLFISLIWSGIDITLLTLGIIDSQGNRGEAWGFIIFVVFHMMPVWLYLLSLIVMLCRYHNTQYIITNKFVYVSRGAFKFHYEHQSLSQIKNTEYHRGLFDKLFGVGDLALEMPSKKNKDDSSHYQIINISDYQKVNEIILKETSKK